MAKLKATNTKVVKTKSEPPKKGRIAIAIDAIKNPNKYYKPDEIRNDVPKPKTTKTFAVNDPLYYKDRAKRYNDSLTKYNKGESERAKVKKDVVERVNNYNKNKRFWEPAVEYGGENFVKGYSVDDNSVKQYVKQEVRHKKSANSYAKLWTPPDEALFKNRNDGTTYLGTFSNHYPKPEYRPNYTPKKATTTKPKTVKPTTATKSTNKSTAPTKSNNSFTVKKTSMPTVAPKPTVKPVTKPVATKPIVKPVVKDTVAAKPVVKPIVKPTVTPVSKPAQKVPTIKSSNNYGDTGTVRGGPYVETKSKMPAKKAGSQFKTTKKNYN